MMILQAMIHEEKGNALGKASLLAQQWQDLRALEPALRIREAANKLGVSEMELLCTRIGSGVIPLSGDFKAMLGSLEPLGEVMALTRNDHMVHERKGIYRNVGFEHGGKIGLVVNADIDLRLFMQHWRHAFAVEEMARGCLRQSIQFFDASGVAIHKIYLTDNSYTALFAPWVERFKGDVNAQWQVAKAPPKAAERPDDSVDVKGLRTSWRNLKDTHDFYLLLAKYDVSRPQALRLAGEPFATPLETKEILQVIFGLVVKEVCEIMVFVGNKACIQIHTGPIHKLVHAQGWYNVLDEKFNLHAKEQAIAKAWVTRKPTEEGTVTAIECFDQQGNLILQLFGRRKPGQRELGTWRDIVRQIEQTRGPVAKHVH